MLRYLNKIGNKLKYVLKYYYVINTYGKAFCRLSFFYLALAKYKSCPFYPLETPGITYDIVIAGGRLR